MEVYLGNPGEKFTAWCKANYKKPLPKDPSEGGVWNVKVNDEWWASQLNIPQGNTIKLPYYNGGWGAENINSENGYINIYYDNSEKYWDVHIVGAQENADKVWVGRQDGSITVTTLEIYDLGGLVITWSPE